MWAWAPECVRAGEVRSTLLHWPLHPVIHKTPACARSSAAPLQERHARSAMEGEMQLVQADKARAAAAVSAREEAVRERQRSAIAMTGSARPSTGSRRKFGL